MGQQNLQYLQLGKISADPKTNIRRTTVVDDEFVASIKAQGVLEPVLVREKDARLVIGFRRYAAAKQAGLKEIPAVLGSWTDEEILEMQLVENMQRQDLDPIEEAYALKKVLEGTKLKQGDLGKRLGKSQPWIAQRLRLLELPESVQESVVKGDLSPKHAERLLTVKSKEAQEAAAVDAARGNLSVNELDRRLAPMRKAEIYFAKVKVKACPKCKKEVTIEALLADPWQFDYGDPKQLSCASCDSEWNSQTGVVTFDGTAPEKESSGASRESAKGREKELAERAESRRKQKEAQLEDPTFRSQATPLDWASSWLSRLHPESVVSVEFVHGDDPLDENRVVIYATKKAVPFTARVRAVEYSTGHVAQVFADPDSVGQDDRFAGRYYNPDKAAIAANKKKIHEWQGDFLKAAKKVKFRDAKAFDLKILEGDVQKIGENIGKVDNLEHLEVLRRAETSGKNRTGVMEMVDGAIRSKGGWTL